MSLLDRYGSLYNVITYMNVELLVSTVKQSIGNLYPPSNKELKR